MVGLPRHIAIVMDGNGRWAENRHLSRSAGHQAGAKAVKKVVKACVVKGIEVLTLFAFGSENWGRPEKEVNHLMSLFSKSLEKETKELHATNVKLHFIGNRSRLSETLCASIARSEQITSQNTGLNLIIAIDYSGRWELIEAIRKLGTRIKDGVLNVEDITNSVLNNVLAFCNVPDPDLFIRTSGEKRISNFMLWQLAYTELYFTDILWPDFDELAFEEALMDFSKRQRRFGLTNQQAIRSA